MVDRISVRTTRTRFMETSFQLQFTARLLKSQSRKCKQTEKKETAALRRHLIKGDQQLAAIHAENAIFQRNQAVNFMQVASRVEAVSLRLKSIASMCQVTNSMARISHSLQQHAGVMTLAKVTGLMNMFEKQMEDMDVMSEIVDQSIKDTTTSSTPQRDVRGLMTQIAEEQGLQLSEQFGKIEVSNDPEAGGEQEVKQEQRKVMARFEKLKK